MLIPEQLADGALAAMTQQFADVINAAGAPKGACLFASIAKARSIDLAAESARETTVDGRAVFFSPSISAVVRLIVSSRARPTPPPSGVRWSCWLVTRKTGIYCRETRTSHGLGSALSSVKLSFQ